MIGRRIHARYYDPRPAQFSEDTYEEQIDNPLSLNLYTYVENNPLTYQDPCGHCIPGSSGCMYQDDMSEYKLLIYQTAIKKNPEDMQYNDKSKEQLKDKKGLIE